MTSPTPTEIAEAVERLTRKLIQSSPAHAFFPNPEDVSLLLAAYTARGEALAEGVAAFDLVHEAFNPDCTDWPADCECEPCTIRRRGERFLTAARPLTPTQDPDQ